MWIPPLSWSYVLLLSICDRSEMHWNQWRRILMTWKLQQKNEAWLNHFPPIVGFETRSARIKIQCSNHWAEESTSWRSCQRLNIYLQAMRNLPRQTVEGRSAKPWPPPPPPPPLPPILGSHHLWWREPIFDEVKSNPGLAPSYDMKVTTKEWSLAEKKNPPIVGFEHGLPG